MDGVEGSNHPQLLPSLGDLAAESVAEETETNKKKATALKSEKPGSTPF